MRKRSADQVEILSSEWIVMLLAGSGADDA
jgi:hypothetical protein